MVWVVAGRRTPGLFRERYAPLGKHGVAHVYNHWCFTPPLRKATGQGRAIYVLVNNRAEGSARLTILAIVDALLNEV